MSRFNDGDSVVTTENLGGVLGGAVRAGTPGFVVRTEFGLFDEKITVRFNDGRTETVKASQLKRESGWH